jgi:phage baseplate assembly protein W
VSTNHAGEIELVAFEEDIRQAIRIILETAQGERVMRPDFGSGLHELLFEPVNATTMALVRHRVEQALIAWEPRIERCRRCASNLMRPRPASCSLTLAIWCNPPTLFTTWSIHSICVRGGREY